MISFDEIPPWDQIPYYQPIQRVVVSLIGGQQQQIFQYDQFRTAIIFAGNSGSVWVDPNPQLIAGADATTQQGIKVNATTNPFSYVSREYGPFVWSEWWAAVPNGLAGTQQIIAYSVRLLTWADDYEAITSKLRSRSKPNGIPSDTRPERQSLWDMVFSACRSQGNGFKRSRSSFGTGNKSQSY